MSRKLIVFAAAAVSICMLWFFAGTVQADVKDSSFTVEDGDSYYGTLYGAPYSENDDSKWLTLKVGGRGLRVVNSADEEILMVDQYGGVYLQGTKAAGASEEHISNGFLYLLIVASLALNVINFVKKPKQKGQ